MHYLILLVRNSEWMTNFFFCSYTNLRIHAHLLIRIHVLYIFYIPVYYINVPQLTVNLQECFLIANRFLPHMEHKCRSPRCLREVVKNILKSWNFNVCLWIRPRISLLDRHSGNEWRSINRCWSLSLLEQNIGRWFFLNLLQNNAKQILPKGLLKHTEKT